MCGAKSACVEQRVSIHVRAGRGGGEMGEREQWEGRKRREVVSSSKRREGESFFKSREGESFFKSREGESFS